MADIDHRHTHAGQPPDDIEQKLDLGRRQRRGRLVHHDDAGLLRHSAGDFDHLLLADRQIAGSRHGVDGEPDPVEQVGGIAADAAPIDRTKPADRQIFQGDVFRDTEFGDQGDFLKHHFDAQIQRIAGRADLGLPSANGDRAGILGISARQNLDQR